jgi:Family of unknown function (DUF6152)
MMNRRTFLETSGRTLTVVAIGVLASSRSWAHHGWGWATDEEFELTGQIQSVRLGNPHGEMILKVDDAIWEVEIGQPWRNSRAGLTVDLLSAGTEVTVHGHRSSNPHVLLMKAERLIIAGKDYNLYPDRAS